MKLDDFTTKTLDNGYCEITFSSPLTMKDDVHDLNLLLEYFGQKKHKKKIRIVGLKHPFSFQTIVVKQKAWAGFMEYINLEGRGWYARMRDKPLTTEEGLKIIDFLCKGYVSIEKNPYKRR